ncbi:MAG TPA: hypothetical protein VGL53_17085 [Bryobacteraceae bacterium]
MYSVITRRSLLPMLALAGLSAACLMAADKPNFSGSWKMDASKSDFGPMPAPDKLEQTITHADPNLSFTTVSNGANGESKTDTVYTTDGKESVNKVRNMEVKSVAAWDGDKLVVKSKREVQGMEISLVETWSLSTDGKVLTIVRNASTPQGDFTLTTVMNKADGASAAAAPAPAATASVAPSSGKRADFTGEWKLNIDKSNFGPVPPPTSETQKVDHHDPALKVTTISSGMDGDHTDNAAYATDGSESSNDFRGSAAKSVAKWEGDTLVISTKVDYQGMEITLKSGWKLSDDGKTLNVATKIMTPQGDFDLANVFDKVK